MTMNGPRHHDATIATEFFTGLAYQAFAAATGDFESPNTPDAPPAWVTLDTETTGLGDDATVLEVAVVDSWGRRLLDTCVHPGFAMSEVPGQHVHGITPAELNDAPSWEEVAPRLRDALAESDVVVWNADFDRPRLIGTLRRAGLDPDSVLPGPDRWACAMTHYAALNGQWSEWHGDWKFVSLEDALERQDSQVSQDLWHNLQLHRAGDDAEGTRRVIWAIGTEGAPDPVPVPHGDSQATGDSESPFDRPSPSDVDDDLGGAPGIVRNEPKPPYIANLEFDLESALTLRPALVLDLDGTVRQSKTGGFIDGPNDVEIIPGVASVLHEWRAAGYLIIGATNQGGVACGYKTPEQVILENKRTHDLTEDVFLCICTAWTHPNGPEPSLARRSLLRKPKYGMLALAENEAIENGYGIVWDSSIMVGDGDEDQACAEAAGIAFQWASTFFGT